MKRVFLCIISSMIITVSFVGCGNNQSLKDNTTATTENVTDMKETSSAENITEADTTEADTSEVDTTEAILETTTEEITEEQTEEVDMKKESANTTLSQFYFNSKLYSLPMTWSQLEEIYGEKIEVWDKYPDQLYTFNRVYGSVQIYTHNSVNHAQIYFRSTDENEARYDGDNSIIYGISDSATYEELYYQGLGYGSTDEDVKAVFGEPDDISPVESSDGTLQSERYVYNKDNVKISITITRAEDVEYGSNHGIIVNPPGHISLMSITLTNV